MGQGAKFVLNLASTMILARLLTPQDFGLVAMVTAVTGFIMTFKDLGLSMATVQRAEIGHAQVSTLFWINVALSAALMLITLALAPAIAWFYKEPRLLPITAALSTAFLLGGLTVQHQALLRRQMRLAAVATIDVVSMATGILTALACAWAGWGYWALVCMQVATAAANAAGVWLACDWRPGRPERRSGVRSMLAFGGYMTVFSFVNYFSRNADNALIGRYCGAGPLGLYSRAYSLLLLPIGQIVAPMTSVAVPALSRLQQDPERYRNYYLRGVKIVAYLSFPLVATLTVLSTEVVLLVLGKRWLGAAPIFRILALTAMFQPVVSTVGWIYVSLGHTRRYAIWGVISASLIVTSFLIGLRWGALGVATGYAICMTLLIHPYFAFAMACSPLAPRDVYRSIYRPFLLSAFVALGMACARVLFPQMDPIPTVVCSMMSGGLACAGCIIVWPAARRDVREAALVCASVLRR